MRNNLKIAVISVIGLLTITVISAMTINNVPVINAAKGEAALAIAKMKHTVT
jgi:hypothetical protein